MFMFIQFQVFAQMKSMFFFRNFPTTTKPPERNPAS